MKGWILFGVVLLGFYGVALGAFVFVNKQWPPQPAETARPSLAPTRARGLHPGAFDGGTP